MPKVKELHQVPEVLSSEAWLQTPVLALNNTEVTHTDPVTPSKRGQKENCLGMCGKCVCMRYEKGREGQRD